MVEAGDTRAGAGSGQRTCMNTSEGALRKSIAAAWNPDKGANIMKSSSRDSVEGEFHEMKGKLKEKVGQLTNNRSLQARGKVEKAAGKVQKKIG